MSAESIGKVKAGSGRMVEVFWNPSSQEVYVGLGGKTQIGKASSAAEAMRKAEAYCYNK